MHTEFDIWQNDIINAIREVIDVELSPKDCLLANVIAFKLMKSPLWREEFRGASLNIHNNDTGYSYITIPKFSDPDNSSLFIRGEDLRLNILEYMYDEYGVCEGEDVEIWPRDYDAKSIELTSLPELQGLQEALDVLRQNPYYDMLLTTDVEAIRAYKLRLNDFTFKALKDADLQKLNELCGISRYSLNTISQIFGHRYANYTDNRIHIVAMNSLGPVGIICLFDHSMQEKPDLLSISYVSVSPGYRRKGLGSRLMMKAFAYCLENGKVLSSTDPTEIGEHTVEPFNNLARRHFPSLPFMSRKEERIYHLVQRESSYASLDYNERCRALQAALKHVRTHESEFTFDYDDHLLGEALKAARAEMRREHDTEKGYSEADLAP